MGGAVKITLRFIAIILFQMLVLNKITLRWWAQPAGFPVFVPYIYPLFILLLPLRMPVWQTLMLGFCTGITVDIFMNTAGMHAFATVLMAWLRLNVLTALLPKNMVEYANQSPGVKNLGWLPFIVYSGFLLLIHHAAFFTIEFWSFANAGILLMKIFASASTSLLLVIAYLLLFTSQPQARN